MPGRQNKYLGTARVAAFRLRFQGEGSRRLRRKLAHQLQRYSALLRQGGFVSGHHRREGKSAVFAGQYFSTANKIELRGSNAEARHPENGPRANAVSRGRNDRRTEAQQISQPLLWARGLRTKGRVRHSRGVRFADRTDLS